MLTIVYRNIWLGITYYNFCYSANMLNKGHVDLTVNDTIVLPDIQWNVFIKFSKQIATTFAKTINGYIVYRNIWLRNTYYDFCYSANMLNIRIRVPKVQFRFFDKLKNEIKKSILRFCFYFNKEDEIQTTDYHFHV